MPNRPVAILAVILTLCASTAAGQDDDDVWQPFRPLLGRWVGEGAGFGSVSDVTHEWEPVLQGRFLRLQTASVARSDDGAGEVHEDVGYLSNDPGRAAFTFRQFLSEGFVNTFDVTVEADQRLVLMFGARDSEAAGGMRAQMRLTFLSPDEYEMVLDLAGPGKDFVPCQRMRMTRER